MKPANELEAYILTKIYKTKWHAECINCSKTYKEHPIYTIEFRGICINLCKECMLKFAMEMNDFLLKEKDK